MDEGLHGGDSEDGGQGVIGSFPSEERRRSSSADSEVEFFGRNTI